jgi:ketosteroid isomerase-like protein
VVVQQQELPAEANTHTVQLAGNSDYMKGLVSLEMTQKDHLQHEKAAHLTASQSRHLGSYLMLHEHIPTRMQPGGMHLSYKAMH